MVLIIVNWIYVYLLIFLSRALGQMHEHPKANEASIEGYSKIAWCLTSTARNEARTECILPGTYNTMQREPPKQYQGCIYVPDIAREFLHIYVTDIAWEFSHMYVTDIAWEVRHVYVTDIAWGVLYINVTDIACDVLHIYVPDIAWEFLGIYTSLTVTWEMWYYFF